MPTVNFRRAGAGRRLLKAWGLCLLASAVAFPLTAKDQPLSNVFFDEEHDLFYQEQFHALMGRVREEIPRAYRSVVGQWGLPDAGGLTHPLTVQVKQLASETLMRTKVAYVQPKGRGSGLRQFLVVDIGCYMQHPEQDMKLVITHEMAHVILTDIESEPGSASIPSWFNEGLAQSVTSEGRDRVRSDIAALHRTGAPLLLCDLEGPVDEFAHGPFNLNSGCYPEFYLAVERMKQLGGPPTLAKVVNGLRQGTKMPEMIYSVTSMDWPAFKKEVNRYALDVFQGNKPVP